MVTCRLVGLVGLVRIQWTSQLPAVSQFTVWVMFWLLLWTIWTTQYWLNEYLFKTTTTSTKPTDLFTHPVPPRLPEWLDLLYWWILLVSLDWTSFLDFLLLNYISFGINMNLFLKLRFHSCSLEFSNFNYFCYLCVLAHYPLLAPFAPSTKERWSVFTHFSRYVIRSLGGKVLFVLLDSLIQVGNCCCCCGLVKREILDVIWNNLI